MALTLFGPKTDTEAKIMQSTSKRDEPSQRPQPPQGKGMPSTTQVQSVRKDVTVRLSLATPSPAEADELQEKGYGHGV